MKIYRYLISMIIFLLICIGMAYGTGVTSEEDKCTLELAKAYYSNGDFTKSFYIINEYLINYPTNSSAWNLKGLIFLANGSYDQAEESFLMALNNSANDGRLLYNLGLTAYYRGDLISANEYFNQSLTYDLQSADLFFYWGLVKYGLKEYSDAIKSLTQATELRPDDPATWFNLGMAYEKARKFDHAVMAYDSAIDRDPTFKKPWFFRGRIYSSLGNESLATASFKIYTQLEPNDDLGWFWYSKLLKRTNQINESIEALNRAISLNPDNTEYQMYHTFYSGDYSHTPVEYFFTPLPSHFILLIFGILVISLVVAVFRG